MDPQDRDDAASGRTSRRQLLGGAGAAALGLAAVVGGGGGGSPGPADAAEDHPVDKVIKKGRIKQSLVHWCYEPYFDVPQMIKVAKQLGCGSIELIAPRHFPLLKEARLVCAIGQIDMAPDPPFLKGFNNPKYRDRVLKATREAIDANADFGFKQVICFTGYAEGLSPEEGAKHCVEGFKQIVGHAEKKGVTLSLEMLNTRETTHPMKGHPGYQGDHVDYCIDIIKRVGSPNLKLLFDVYHVQIQDGDIIRRLRQDKQYISHIHTAGNPGRGELDDTQEIQYKPIMEALVEIGYDGYVGQEFIPTRDALAGLRQAVAVCDV